MLWSFALISLLHFLRFDAEKSISNEHIKALPKFIKNTAELLGFSGVKKGLCPSCLGAEKLSAPDPASQKIFRLIILAVKKTPYLVGFRRSSLPVSFCWKEYLL